MIDVNLSDEEQVDALKNWWKENGRSVVGGVVLGLGLVFGWQAWTQHQTRIAGQASSQFERLQQSLQAGAYESAGKQAEGIIAEFGGSAYATFAALDSTKVKYSQGDTAAAVVQVKTVADGASDESLRQIARLRMARIMLSEGQLDSAAATIVDNVDGSFRGEFAELRGDLALAGGNKADARSAYQEALDNQVSNASLVQMKMDDLAVAVNP